MVARGESGLPCLCTRDTDSARAATVLDAMDEWLSNIARDTAPARSALDKVVRNKPSNLVDTCYLATLDPVTDPSRCQVMFPVLPIHGSWPDRRSRKTD